MNLFDLTGEVAVVIGATGVLGGALAEGLAMAGAKVAVLGRTADRGATRVKKIKADGAGAAISGAGIGGQRSARELHYSGILSGRTESQAALQRGWLSDAAHQIDFRPHADATFWRSPGVSWSCHFSGQRQSEQLCHRGGYSGGRRLFGTNDLRK